jgi:RND family efflux transporter MFP subunit
MNNIKKILFTLIFCAFAVLVIFLAWQRETGQKWTRDGRIRADVVVLSGEVNGRLLHLNVKDNQYVHKGDLLFEIDPSDYAVTVAEKEAALRSAGAKMDQMSEMAKRRARLGSSLVSGEEVSNSRQSYRQAQADYERIASQLRMARIQLARTQVRSPVDGYVTNQTIQQGDYIKTGDPVLTLVDSNSFYVYGYFQEDQINHIKSGDRAVIKLLGSNISIRGQVESIARGINDYSNSGGEGKLHNVNPTFEWVRLPMRIPVRIRLDKLSTHGVVLVSGMTCTVDLAI